MTVTIVSHNSIFNEGISRACRERDISIRRQCHSITLLDATDIGDVLLWHFTADDAAPQEDMKAFASAHPDVRIVALAPNGLCCVLEAECGGLLAAVLPESASADAVISVLLLAGQGYQIKRTATPTNGPSAPGQVVPKPFVNTHHPALSERETAVLLYLCAGYSNKSIARALGICDATVKAHLRSSFRRIGATNRTQAALWATKNIGETQEHAGNGAWPTHSTPAA